LTQIVASLTFNKTHKIPFRLLPECIIGFQSVSIFCWPISFEEKQQSTQTNKILYGTFRKQKIIKKYSNAFFTNQTNALKFVPFKNLTNQWFFNECSVSNMKLSKLMLRFFFAVTRTFVCPSLLEKLQNFGHKNLMKHASPEIQWDFISWIFQFLYKNSRHNLEPKIQAKDSEKP
jgi:hypothetical protein